MVMFETFIWAEARVVNTCFAIVYCAVTLSPSCAADKAVPMLPRLSL